MKFTIKTEAIRNALAKTLSVVDKRNTRPILTYCYFRAHENSLEMIATDSEISAKVVVTINVEKPGTFCIQAKNLFDILRELPDSTVLFEIESDSNILKLNCNEIKYSLLICSPEEFPQIIFNHTAKTLTLTSLQIEDIIKKTSHAISTDETRLYLNGLFLQEVDSHLRAVATDGHRLAMIDEKECQSSNESLINGIIVPKKGVLELKRMAESFIDEKIQISVDESFLYASVNDVYFLSIRLISRDYPKYQAVIPSKTTYKLDVDRDAFLTAVRRIKILSNEKSNGVKLSITSKNLTISANHPSLGDALEKLPINYEGKDISIGVNAKFLIDTFSVLDDSDVTLEFNNEISPVVIKSANRPDFLGIIMPLKI